MVRGFEVRDLAKRQVTGTRRGDMGKCSEIGVRLHGVLLRPLGRRRARMEGLLTHWDPASTARKQGTRLLRRTEGLPLLW